MSNVNDPEPSPAAALLEPEADVASMLPGPNSVLAHLAERLAVAAELPSALVVVRLLRGEETWPTPASTLSAATAIVARSLRGDDWLGRSGTDEFAVLLSGDVPAAEAAATRVTGTITGLGIPGLGACAAVAALEPGATAREIMRRASAALRTARAAGTGSVIRYDGGR